MKHITITLFFLMLSVSVFAEQIEKIDINFAVGKVDGINFVYKNALEAPFELEGFAWYEKGKPLKRIPHSIKENDINNGVYVLANHTAGGVIRFRTDSPYIAIRARLLKKSQMIGHMPATGVSGFDLFRGWYRYNANPFAGGKLSDPVERVIARKGQGGVGMQDCAVYLPLYNGVEAIEIGIEPNAKIEPPTPRKIKKPILFYGSSITQGACASRPSNAYCAMLCRAVDAPMINLGFSGSAKGEEKMAELIAELDLSVFVYDYDHNAPDAAHLRATHEKFFKIIRAKKPDLPIIMLSRISTVRAKERFEIVKQTYDNAIKNGDKNVWLVDGADFTRAIDNAYWTMDNTHPNDFGFYLMFKRVLPVLEEALKR